MLLQVFDCNIFVNFACLKTFDAVTIFFKCIFIQVGIAEVFKIRLACLRPGDKYSHELVGRICPLLAKKTVFFLLKLFQ